MAFVVSGLPAGGVRRGQSRGVVVCSAEERKNGGWRKLAAVVVAGFSLMGKPTDASARGGGAMFRMTESAAEFVLPSEKEARRRAEKKEEGESRLKSAAKVAISVAPYVVGTGAVVGGGYYAIQRFQQSQVKRFQKDLQSMSSMFGDVDSGPVVRQKRQPVDTAAVAKNILEKSKTKYKFRERKPATDRSSQIKLDLFKDQPDQTKTTSSEPPSVETEVIPPPSAESSLEKAVAEYLKDSGSIDAAKNAATEMQLSDEEAVAKIYEFGANTLNTKVDEVVSKLRVIMSGAAVMPPLAEVSDLATTVSKLRTLAQQGFDKDISLRYTGKMLNSEMADEVYRIFAISILSQGAGQDSERVAQLEDMQDLLAITPENAQAIYEEVVKAMMQEAVSQANLDPQAKEMLEKLRGAFNEENGGSTGDMSEDVMQMMYALQQLMTEQGISDEDAREMRKMMKEMGVDVQDLIKNAEMLSGVLGPQAKPLIESLKKLLTDENDSVTEVRATPVQESQDDSQSQKRFEPPSLSS